MWRSIATAMLVFCFLFSIALAIADIRGGAFTMAIFAAAFAGAREAA